MVSDKKKPSSYKLADADADADAGADPVNWLPTANSLGTPPAEFYGPKGLEPTRYGDWEQKGRCTDF